jgi:hypothetical protein
MTNVASNSPRDSDKSLQYDTVSAIKNIFRSTISSIYRFTISIMQSVSILLENRLFVLCTSKADDGEGKNRKKAMLQRKHIQLALQKIWHMQVHFIF